MEKLPIKIKIPKNFLKEETICDYFVSADMKKVWAVQIDILEKLKQIFTKYDIKYIADGGTILGAVRHNGYIPWDDDIDLIIEENDYYRLIDILKNVLKKPYSFKECKWNRGFLKIFNDETFCGELVDGESYHGIFIDVFRGIKDENTKMYSSSFYGLNEKKNNYTTFNNIIREKFCFTNINIPFDYDNVLTKMYGNWRDFPKKKESHHPFMTVNIPKNYCLCTIFNDAYFDYASILIKSFLVNNPWFIGDFVCIYDDKYIILSDNIKNKMSEIYNKTVFKKIDSSIYDVLIEKWMIDTPNYLKRWKTVFFKNEIFRLIEYDTVLFLDSDVIINDNIQDLFNLNYGVYFCYDLPLSKGKSTNKIKTKDKDDYINAGFILLRGNKVINNEYYSKIYNLYLDNKITFFPEQDIFSHYLDIDCYILPDNTFQLMYYWDNNNYSNIEKNIRGRIIHYIYKYDKIKKPNYFIFKQIAYYYKNSITNKLKNLKENGKIDIFVCSHQYYNIDILNQSYKNISDIYYEKTINQQFKEQNVPEVTNMQRSYGECSRMYWVWKKYDNLKKYVGFCHYRRFFNFYEDIPDMDKLFKYYNAICAEPIDRNKIVKEYFSGYNQINFLIEWLKVLNEVHPEYTKKEIKKFLNGNIIGMRNMYILKKEDFYKYMEWCFSIAEEFNKRNNLKVQSDVTEYCKRKCNEWNVPYNEGYDRLHGFLFEICETLYFRHNFKKILTLPLKFIE